MTWDDIMRHVERISNRRHAAPDEDAWTETDRAPFEDFLKQFAGVSNVQPFVDQARLAMDRMAAKPATAENWPAFQRLVVTLRHLRSRVPMIPA